MVRPAFGDHGSAAIAALVRRDINRSGVRYFVAERDGALVGTTRLAIEQDLAPDGLRPLAAQIGWPAAIRGALVLGLLAHRRLAPGDAYIEELAVRADARRQGIATRLVRRCEAEAARWNKRRITLWVAADNAPAVAMYSSRGFRPVRHRSTLVGRLVFRVPSLILMCRDLAGLDQPSFD